MKVFFKSLLFLLLIACQEKPLTIIELEIDKASIPEGIAIHPETKDIFISSVHLDKITRSSTNGKRSEDIVNSEQYDYSVGVGLEVVNNQLFALGSINREKRSMVLQIDLENNQLLNRFMLPDSIPCFFNDLAIDDQRNIYITDTEFHKIYKLNPAIGQLELFLEHQQIKYPNGIAISENGKKLFIDSYSSGIRIVDIASKKILNKYHEASADKGLDGLKYHKGKLYAIINGRAVAKEQYGLYAFVLSEEENEIRQTTPLLLNHKLMNLPTTFDIIDDYAYILANSQMDNLDQEKNEIIHPDSLTTTYVLKLKIE